MLIVTILKFSFNFLHFQPQNHILFDGYDVCLCLTPINNNYIQRINRGYTFPRIKE